MADNKKKKVEVPEYDKNANYVLKNGVDSFSVAQYKSLVDDYSQYGESLSKNSGKYQSKEVIAARKENLASLDRRRIKLENDFKSSSLSDESYSNGFKSMADFSKKLSGYVGDTESYYSQFKDENDYNTQRRNSQYYQKYQGFTYKQVKDAINNAGKNKTSQEEVDWLNRYMTSESVVSTMTDDELKTYISDTQGKTDALVKQRNDVERQLAALQLSTHSHGATSEDRDKKKALQKQIDDLNKQIKNSPANNGVLYFDADGNPVTAQGVLNQRKGKAATEALNSNPQARQIADEIERLEAQRDKKVELSIEGADKAGASGGILQGALHQISNQMDAVFKDERGYDYQIALKKKQLKDMGYDYDTSKAYTDSQYYKAMADTIAKNEKEFASQHPVLSTAGSIALAPLQAAEYAENAIGAVKGEQANIYDDYFTNFSGNVTGQVAQDINDAVLEKTNNKTLAWLASGAYSGITSSLQSAAATAACMAIFGPAGEYISLGLMGMEAANGTFQDVVKRGGSNGQALASSLAAGFAEGLFEYFSIEKLKGVKKLIDSGAWDTTSLANFLKSLGKNSGKVMMQGFVEASEEGFTDIFNNIADAWIMQDKSEYNTAVSRYMLENNMSREEAEKQAFKDTVSSVFESMYGGFVGGAGTAMTTYAVKTPIAQARATSARNQQIGDALSSNEAIPKLISQANELTDSESNKKAKELSQKLQNVDTSTEKGQKQAQKIAGKLYSEMQRTSFAAVTEADTKGLENAVRGELESKGISGKTLDSAVSAIVKSESGKTLKKAEQRIFDEVSGADILEAVKSSNRYDEEKAKIASEAMRNLRRTSGLLATAPHKVSETGVTIDNTTGEEVKVKNISSITKDSSGKATMMLTLDNGKTIKSTDVSFGNNTDAALFDGIASFDVNSTTANEIYKAYNRKGNISVETYLLGMEEGVKYGYTNYGIENTSKSSYFSLLSPEQQQIAYRLGQSEARLSTRVRENKLSTEKSKGKTKNTSRSGRVTYDFDTSVLEKDSARKRSVDALENIVTTITKNNVILIESQLDENGRRVLDKDYPGYKQGTTAPNGIYDEATGNIYIDINAGNNGEGAILWTLAHELTHDMRARAPKQFKVLSDFLMHEYGDAGVDIQTLIEERMAAENLSFDAAEEEIVADSMSKMFTDTDIADKLERLKQKDRTVWQRIKDFFEKLKKSLAAVREDYKKFDSQNDAMRAFDQLTKNVDRITELFAEGIVAASNVDIAPGQNSIQIGNTAINIDEATGSASIDAVMSARFAPQNQEEIDKAAQELAQQLGIELDKAKEWIDQELSLASLILNDRFLDYVGDDDYAAIKNNSDYPQGTVDFSNICRKRRDYTEMMNRIQKKFPDHMFTAEDYATIREIMVNNDMEVACGICYVEDRRQNTGIIAKMFIEAVNGHTRVFDDNTKRYKRINKNQKAALELLTDSYKPTQYDLTTAEGFEKLRKNHPNVAEVFTKFNNARGMAAGRLLEGEAEYKRQILDYTPERVQKINDNGGLRIYSFSDFEEIHLIDVVQVIQDCARMGIKIQGYTKVPSFAKMLMDTGVKLNRSLIPKGNLGYHYEAGKVVLDYDTTEGIDVNDADFFDSSDNPNVGNILVGINDVQIRAAMTDDFVDYIIPFHTNQKKTVLGIKKLSEWTNYKLKQTDKYSNGRTAKTQINIYTDVLNAAAAEGKPITNKVDFVNYFLNVAKEKGLTPRFADFLDKNAKGEYVYTEGYHKFLVDFKLFDKDGNILPQNVVRPDFNLEYMQGLLTDYISQQEAKSSTMSEKQQKVFDEIQHDVIEKGSAKLSSRDSEYFEAVKSNDMETAQKLVDDAAREAGYTIKAYHGTFEDFTVFDISKTNSSNDLGKGFYFTTDESDAKNNYASQSGGDVQTKIEELAFELFSEAGFSEEDMYDDDYIEDYNNAYDRAEAFYKSGKVLPVYIKLTNPLFVESATSYKLVDTKGNSVVGVYESLVKKGYDGIIDKTVSDKFDNVGGNTTHYVVFNPSSIKSAEPVTYSGGEVVPISERFNSANNDIRYSSRDSEGNALSEQQAEYFKDSKVRDADGNLLVVYHGTDMDFTVFDKTKGRANMDIQGMFFSPWELDAQGYGSNVKSYYLNITNPAPEGIAYKALNRFKVQNNAGVKAREYLESLGYDGVNNGDEEYIAFNSNQIKLIDNTAPTENEDIRYSTRDYSYNAFVSKPDMIITDVDTSRALNRADTVSEAKKNAAKIGTVHRDGSVSVKVKDIDTDVLLTKSGLTHSLQRKLDVLSPITTNIGSILQNSIRINELTPKKENVNSSYVLIGVAADNSKTYFVRTVINKYSYEVESVDVLYAISTKKETAANKSPRLTSENSLSVTVSTISISDLLDYVNKYFPDILPEDVLKHYGHDSRPDGELGKSALFSTRDEAYRKNLEVVNAQLERDNAKLAEDLKLAKQMTKLQSKVTRGKMLDPKSLATTAKRVMRENNATGNSAEFANILSEVYGHIMSGEDITWESVTEQLDKAAEWLSQHRKESKTRDEFAETVLSDVRGTKISLTEAQKQEAVKMYGSLDNYRRHMMGKVYITENTQNDLDSQWQEWSQAFPNIFEEGATEGDMVTQLDDIFYRLQSAYSEPYLGDTEMLMQDMRESVYNAFWDTSALYTVADKNQRDIVMLKNKHAEQMQAVRTERDKKIKALKEAQAERIKQLREMSEKKLKETIKHNQESRKKSVDSRHRTELRHKIRKRVKELNDLLLKGTKDKHVPMKLTSTVVAALEAVNMDTVSAEKRIADLDAQIAKAKNAKVIAELQKRRDTVEAQGERMAIRLDALAKAYNSLKDSADSALASAYDENISERIREVADEVGNVPLRDMTLEQLEAVNDMYRAVLHTVKNANKLFKEERQEGVRTAGMSVIKEVKRVREDKKQTLAVAKEVRKFGWNNFKPVYAMKYIGSETLSRLFNNVRAGEDTWAVDVSEAREFYLETAKKYGYNSWDFNKKYEFESSTGRKFSLTLQDIMSIYAYSKRDQAQDHIAKGGIVFDSQKTVVEKKKGLPIKYNINTADAYKIPLDVQVQIIGTLSEKQINFVDEMQAYLSETMGAKGNEVSRAMYDFDIFKEKNYFPLKSAKQYLREQDTQTKGEVRIKNSSFTKEVRKSANNPIIVDGFMDVWADHVNQMSMYHAFTLPLEDFMRVYNYQSFVDEDTDSESVRSTIQSTFSPEANAYIKQLITDLNGGARGGAGTEIGNKLTGLFKKGAVFASASVVIQQPSAIARALAYIDSRHFVFTSGKNLMLHNHNKLWSECKQYAPIAVIKEMGYFDTDMGMQSSEWIKAAEYDGIKEKAAALLRDSDYRKGKVDDILSKAPGLADEITWTHIWLAVKNEVKSQYKQLDVNSEEYLQKCGERFTEVIVNTQVYDSVLSRSGFMRSKDTGVKMATAFMAEPTTSMNMMVDAVITGKRKGGKTGRKYTAKALGAVAASFILNSLLQSIVYAARDDDDDKTYLEKYLGALSGSLADAFNPLTLIPYVKDIMSLIEGYDVERSDMAVISAIVTAYQQLNSGKVSTYKKVEDFGGAIANLFGIPLKNIMRDIRSVNNVIRGAMNGNKTSKQTVLESVKENLPKYLGGGETKKTDSLYNAIMAGDTAAIAKIKKSYKTDKAYQTAVGTALRENDSRIAQATEARLNGDISEYKRLANEIKAEGKFSQDDVVSAINSTESSFNSNLKKLKEADESGNKTESRKAQKALKELGFSDDFIKKNYDAYVPEEESEAKAKGLFKNEDLDSAIEAGEYSYIGEIKQDFIDTKVANGKTEDEATESVNKTISNTIKEYLMSGDISESTAAELLTDYAEIDSDDADTKSKYWAFSARHTDIDVSEAAYKKYQSDVEPSGISEDVYFDYYEQKNKCKGSDADGDGKTDSGSKKAEILKVIDSMPITAAQKDVLYYQNNWSASTINKTPWH